MSRKVGRGDIRRTIGWVSMSWLAAGAIAVVVPAAADGATTAYWRHEENVAVGSIVPDGDDTILDSSGNENHMRTFSSAVAPFTAATYSSTVSPLALRSGLPNTKSLDFGPMPLSGTEDGGDPGNTVFGRNDDNYTEGKPIQSQSFTAMTVELSFRMHSVDGWQALFGKDGKPLGDQFPIGGEDDSPVPPLKFLIRNDAFPNDIPNQLFVEFIDGDGLLNSDIHFVAGGETIVPGQWYHAAFTLSADTAELWVAKETGAYELKDTTTGDFAGEAGNVLVFDPTPFSIGRGMFNNGVADWADALIDEVRVSDAVLAPEEFLFIPNANVQDADFNDDNRVDGTDFLILQRGLGLVGTGTHATGDANGDGDINDADTSIFKSQFGSVATGASGSSVPEPSSITAVLIAVGGIAAGRRRARASAGSVAAR